MDPIAALAPDDKSAYAWLQPGTMQLELGAQVIEGPGPAKPLRVRIIDEHGGQVRLAIDLGYARFSVWAERTQLLALLARDTRIAPANAINSSVHVTLKAGAKLTRLAHDAKTKRTQVRYVGAIETEGWISDDALVDSLALTPATGRIPTGGKTLTLMPGAVIRAEPKWTATQLGVTANSYFVDSLGELPDGWHDVAYTDGEIAVRGFVSKQLPPGKTHRLRIDPERVPPPITPNGKVGSHTCLYLEAGGDPIGYIVGEPEVDLDEAGQGWWHLAIDTPWGALTFAARGASRGELATCGPVASGR